MKIESVEEYFQHCYGKDIRMKDHMFNGRDMIDFADGWAAKKDEEIARLQARISAMETPIIQTHFRDPGDPGF